MTLYMLVTFVCIITLDTAQAYKSIDATNYYLSLLSISLGNESCDWILSL